MKMRFLLIGLLISFSGIASAQDYFVYVAAESEDEVHLVRFNAETQQAEIEETIPVGRFPTEIDGPHGITVAPDGEHWFVSIAHGNPFGLLAKYETATNTLVATTELGMFPATMEISPKTGLLYVVNFDLHGPMRPSNLMVVDPDEMEVLDVIDTGVMPHGSRISTDGAYNYHVSMMSDELIEVSATTMEVTRTLKLTEGMQTMASGEDHSMHQSSMSSFGMNHDEMMHKPVEKPTWADPHPIKPLVYVAANGSDEIIEVDVKSWTVNRRFKTGKAPYNLEVSNDGKWIVATYKGEGSTGVWNLDTGKEVAKIANTRRVSHGVAISPDSKFAFVSVEGIGGEPGSVEVIDIEAGELVDFVETGKQAGGIYFWKMNN
jgi:DNA-binding beta-propeller fold protein YncE